MMSSQSMLWWHRLPHQEQFEQSWFFNCVQRDFQYQSITEYEMIVLVHCTVERAILHVQHRIDSYAWKQWWWQIQPQSYSGMKSWAIVNLCQTWIILLLYFGCLCMWQCDGNSLSMVFRAKAERLLKDAVGNRECHLHSMHSNSTPNLQTQGQNDTDFSAK